MLPDEGADSATAVAAAELNLTVLGVGQLGAWLAARAGQPLGLDVRGSGAPARGDAWGVALADADGDAAAFDLQQIDPVDENALAAWLADPDAPKVVHASKEAWHALAGRGLPLAGVVFDTELAAYLCQPDRRAYDLADLAIGYLRRELGATDADDGGQGLLDLEIDGTDEGRRAAVRAAAVRDLYDVLDGEIADRGAAGLLTDLELPLVDVLARMESTGIAIDHPYLSSLEKSFDAQVQEAAARRLRGDRARGEPRFAQAAARGAVRPARHAQDQEEQDRVHHRRERADRPVRPDAAPVPGAPARAPRRDPAAPDGRGAAPVRSRRTVGSTPRSSRRSRRPDGCRRRTRTCRTSRSAPRPAGRSAARSSSATGTRRC